MRHIRTILLGEAGAMRPDTQRQRNSAPSYQFAWLGDMPVDQERGPLAGRVAGEFGNTTFSFFALNLKWTY